MSEDRSGRTLSHPRRAREPAARPARDFGSRRLEETCLMQQPRAVAERWGGHGRQNYLTGGPRHHSQSALENDQ